MNNKYWITGNLKTFKVKKNSVATESVDESDDIPEVYRTLLEEHGILSPRSKPQSLKHEIKKCCTNMELYENSEALMTCWNCAKVNSSAVPNYAHTFGFSLSNEEDIPHWSNSRRKNFGVQMPSKKRYYSSKIHFTTHLKRYLNHTTPTDISKEIMEDIKKTVAIDDFDAYAHVREYLWRHKLGKYYKDIFSIIYTCGGKVPTLSPQQHQQLDRLINALQHFFYTTRQKWGKKSMPCVSLMLEYLLRQCGHELHYRLHVLKDQNLLSHANEFYLAFLDANGE